MVLKKYMQSFEVVIYSRRNTNLGIKSHVTCSPRYIMILYFVGIGMCAWKAACISKFRILNLINTKKVIDFMSTGVCRFLFFLNTGKTNYFYINMTVLAIWKR